VRSFDEVKEAFLSYITAREGSGCEVIREEEAFASACRRFEEHRVLA